MDGLTVYVVPKQGTGELLALPIVTTVLSGLTSAPAAVRPPSGWSPAM